MCCPQEPNLYDQLCSYRELARGTPSTIIDGVLGVLLPENTLILSASAPPDETIGAPPPNPKRASMAKVTPQNRIDTLNTALAMPHALDSALLTP